MDWFYKKDNEEIGPLDDEAFATHIVDGHIALDTLVWHVDMKEWIPLSEVIKQEGRAANHEAAAARNIEEAFSEPAPPPELHGSSTRAKILDPDENPGPGKGPPPLPPPEARAPVRTSATRLKIQPRVASQPLIPDHLKKVIDAGPQMAPAKLTPPNSDLPASVSSANPNAAFHPSGPPPPSFAHRLCADVTDLAVASLVIAVIAWLAPSGIKSGNAVLFFLPILLVIGLLPHAVCLLLRGTTPGLLVMRLRLRTELGEPCSRGTCLLYPFGLLISVSPLGIGLLTSVLTGERRPLHDMIAGTRAE